MSRHVRTHSNVEGMSWLCKRPENITNSFDLEAVSSGPNYFLEFFPFRVNSFILDNIKIATDWVALGFPS